MSMGDGPGGPNSVVAMLTELLRALNQGDLRVADVVSTIDQDTKYKKVVVQFRSLGHVRHTGTPTRDLDLVLKPEDAGAVQTLEPKKIEYASTVVETVKQVNAKGAADLLKPPKRAKLKLPKKSDSDHKLKGY